MPKKKAAKKKKVSTANKQRQAVNVKIKIDQSRRTNPREPRAAAAAKGSLPSRAYTANSSTPLHTTIMTATPSPAIIQKEPNYSETISQMFKEAESRQNNQLQMIADALAERERGILHLLDENARNAPPPTDQLYDALMKEHISRVPPSFQDPHAKATTRLRTPAKPVVAAEEGFEEEKGEENPAEFTPLPKRTRAKKAQVLGPVVIIKRPVGRPRKTPIPVAEPVAEPVEQPAQQEPDNTPKITKYFRTRKQAQAEEAERQRQEAEAAAAAAAVSTPTPKKKRNRKKSEKKKKLIVEEQ